MKKIDELHASTVGTEDFNALLMAFQLHGRLVSPCDVAETSDSSKDSVITAMPTRSTSMRGLADGTYCLERSTLAMSNSEELYAGKCCTRVLSAWHVHVVERQLFRHPHAQPTP